MLTAVQLTHPVSVLIKQKKELLLLLFYVEWMKSPSYDNKDPKTKGWFLSLSYSQSNQAFIDPENWLE